MPRRVANDGAVLSAGDETRELEHLGAGWKGGLGVHSIKAQGEVAAQEDTRETPGNGAPIALSCRGTAIKHNCIGSWPLIRTVLHLTNGGTNLLLPMHYTVIQGWRDLDCCNCMQQQ